MWIFQAVTAFILAWIFVGPIFSLAFENADRTLSVSGMVYSILVYLLWIWLGQFLAMFLIANCSNNIRGLLLLAGYVGLSVPIALGFNVWQRLAARSTPLKVLAFVLSALVTWKIFQEAGAFFAILFVGGLF